MMKKQFHVFALCLLMPALMMADSPVCVSPDALRGGAHFVLGLVTGAGQGKWADITDKNLQGAPAAANATQEEREKQAAHIGHLKIGADILTSIAGGHLNNAVGVNVVNALLLQQTGDAVQRTDSDRIAAALGQQAGHFAVRRKLGWAMNPFDVVRVFTWLKAQAQSAQDYVTTYEQSNSDKMKSKTKQK